MAAAVTRVKLRFERVDETKRKRHCMTVADDDDNDGLS